MPCVSIITCTYNRASIIGETIQSVLTQTFIDFEYLIIDDGSTDNTKQVVSSFNDSRIIYSYHNHSNGFLSVVRNHGLKKAKGKFISFIDSDDLWQTNALDLQVQALQQNEDVHFTFSDVEVSDLARATTKPLYGKNGFFKGIIYNDYINNKFVIYTSSLSIKRECLSSTGLHDETFFDGDFDFIVSLAYHFKAYINYDRLVKIQKKENSHSSILNSNRFDSYLYTIKKELTKGHITIRDYKRIVQNLSYGFGLLSLEKGMYKLATRYFLKCLTENPFNIKALTRILSLLPKLVFKNSLKSKSTTTS